MTTTLSQAFLLVLASLSILSSAQTCGPAQEGNQMCLTSNTYQTCSNSLFSAPQSCPSGLVCVLCSAINRVYCVRPGENPCGTVSALSTLTLYKILCPSYSKVPANIDACTADATGGHCGELDTSFQTTEVNPMTDIPSACKQAGAGWGFTLTTGSTTQTVFTDVNGAVSVNLAGAQVSVAEILQNSVATFGQLRCYRDVTNGDNLDYVAVPPPATHVYCIAYNVMVPAPPPCSSP